MAQVIKATFQLRRGLLEAWEKNNPILAKGEPSFVLDKNALKIGDGVTPWKELDYIGLNQENLAKAIEDYFEKNPEAGGIGKDGRGIVSITRTEGNGMPGTTDIYTILYSDSTTSTFSIYNGKDGQDGISASLTIKYACSMSNSIEPTVWQNSIPTLTPTEKYLWAQFTKIEGFSSSVWTGVVGIYGDTGPVGDDYVLTDADKAEIAEMAADLVEVPELSDGKADFVVRDTPPEDTSVLWVDTDDNNDDGFQEAVNAALAQAKESGEFDGDDYVLTPDDKTEIAEMAAGLVDFPAEDEFELIETIVCDGSFGNISRLNLSLKKAKIFLNMKVASTAATVCIEATNSAGLFGYSWIGNCINTGERFATALFVSDGMNAYTEFTAPGSTKYNTGGVNRTVYPMNADTPIHRINFYTSPKTTIFPAESTIEIWGVRA